MNLERVGGREDGKGYGSKGETKADCKNWWKKYNCEWRTLPPTMNVPHDTVKHLRKYNEILTAIEPVITKTADRKTIMNYHSRGQTRKTIIGYHEEFEQAQNE